jgi:hypothetical protein
VKSKKVNETGPVISIRKDINEKATKLLRMILALGKATFLRRYRGHFSYNFMAH